MSAPPKQGKDSSVKLFLRFDNNILDGSNVPKVVTNIDVTFSDSIYKSGYSAYFNGSSAVLSLDDHADFNLSGGVWKQSFWFYPTAKQHGTVIYYQETDSENYFMVREIWFGGSQFYLQFLVVSAGVAVVSLSSTQLSLNTWYDIELEEAGNDYYFRVNDVLTSSANISGRPANYTGSVYIGGNAASNFLTGYLDEFWLSQGAEDGPAEARSLKVIGSLLYSVVGDRVSEITNPKNSKIIGTLTANSGQVWIEGDGVNVCVVDGVAGYLWNGTTFAAMTFPGSFVPTSLAFQDGYFIVSKSGTREFYITDDPTNWGSLDYATKEGDSDNLVCVYSHKRILWLFGERTTEIWYNSGAADFPFERYQDGFIKIGCKSARSVCASDDAVFWLDDNLQVRMGTGIQSQVISTTQIDYQIKQLSDHEGAIAFVYQEEGHEFYQLTIASKTLVFDTKTGFWHSRASGESDDRHPAQCHAWFMNRNVVGHYQTGELLAFDLGVYTNNGAMIRAIRAAQVIQNDRKKIFHQSLEIEFESGVGNGASPNPRAILEWSNDDGHTWQSPKYANIGGTTEKTARAIWRRLGQARNRVYRVTIEDPVKRVIVGANLDAESGRS